MRSEVGEWLATCVGSPICILLLSWSLLIYQNQSAAAKRRIDVLTVAILAQSLAHQLGLLLFAILTLIHPANHFGEFCSTLVWLIDSSSILQQLSLTSIAIFAALTVRRSGEEPSTRIKKHHLKYHLASLSVISGCIGITGVLNFEPETCVFLPRDISPKYGLFFNGLGCILLVATLISLLVAMFRAVCRPSPKAELLKSVSDLSEASSKNSTSGAFECQQQQQQQQQHQQQQHWEPSSGSCTSGSTNSRACLKKSHRIRVADENSGWPTVYSILFVCYVFDHLPILIVSLKPGILGNLCRAQNLASWLPLLKDTLLPIFLAIFDKMFCRYVAKVYTKQDRATRLSHGICGVDGKFRHFEQDNEYKLQLNLNHGLKFPMQSNVAVNAAAANCSLYGRLHNQQQQQSRGQCNGSTMQLGLIPHQYDNNTYASIAHQESNYEAANLDNSSKQPSRQHQSRGNLSRANSSCKASTENLMQLEEQSYGYGARRLRHFAKSLDEIREDEIPRRSNTRSVMQHQHEQVERARNHAAALRRNQSFDIHPRYPRIELPFVSSKTYDVKRELAIKRSLHIFEQTRRNNAEYEGKCQEEEAGYETSDDESCDLESQDFDTMSSCRSGRPRSCCSVTTVANDDFEYFQRKSTKEQCAPKQLTSRVAAAPESKGSMRCFTPRMVVEANKQLQGNGSKPVIQSYQLKKKMSPGYSLNDLDKFNNGYCHHPSSAVGARIPTLSIESLKSILRSSDISYLDNGEICRHDIGGSAPDFKKIFVTEFI
ncbi:uncharacterized protein LOC100678531 [Nasonia vitripennis]|uniref:G-protein coupled receptors family 1 profile domain-containing protein n=1 Tax=Nasonia vitripennis TaxID=7425 RepID=A0A7M7GBQ2_NASVI|nr:uncharacterized protein LOC100678531 [Nasonia vitripennis]XP_008202719.1 uncharacterized protein LOC100678531 [Nasonia vitripennis]